MIYSFANFTIAKPTLQNYEDYVMFCVKKKKKKNIFSADNTDCGYAPNLNSPDPLELV